MRIFFIATFVGVIIAAVAGLPLLWDGSFYLLQLLNLQVPFLPKYRLINFPLQLLPLVASYFTQNIVLLRFIFSLCYTAIPFIALALSWWIVRKSKPTLMIWPALCIALVTIAGQTAFINEGNSVIQLFWPVFLALLVPCSASTIIVISVIAALLAFSHPFGIVLIGFAALIAIYTALRTKRRMLWLLACYFLFITLAGLVYSSVLDRADAQLVSIGIIIEGFKTIGKLKAVGIICAYVVGAGILFTSQIQKRLSLSFRAILYLLLVLEIVGCAVFIVFASDPTLWYVNFHWVEVIIILPMIAATIWDAQQLHDADWHLRKPLIQMAGFSFCAVLLVYGLSYYRLTEHLQTEISQLPEGCTTMQSVHWITSTPLEHWSIMSYSILLQGRVPTKAIIDVQSCETTNFKNGIILFAGGEPWLPANHWFDFTMLIRNLGLPSPS